MKFPMTTLRSWPSDGLTDRPIAHGSQGWFEPMGLYKGSGGGARSDAVVWERAYSGRRRGMEQG
jgi:hypothetical protein